MLPLIIRKRKFRGSWEKIPLERSCRNSSQSLLSSSPSMINTIGPAVEQAPSLSGPSKYFLNCVSIDNCS